MGGVQLNVTADEVTFRIRGIPGAPGNFEKSGTRCTLEFDDDSTDSVADHDVSPLSEYAIQVYNPESETLKSENVNYTNIL